MNTQSKLIQIRSKKLGLLITDARLTAHKSLEDCANALGITSATMQSYESGTAAPSLPEIEALAYYLNTPLKHFWSSEALSQSTKDRSIDHADRLALLRRRIIATRLRITRDQQNKSLKELAEQSGITEPVLKQYEAAEISIPLPELEILANLLQVRVDDFIDQHGPIGNWHNQQLTAQKFLELPPEVQSFICKPVNRPYINLAMRLSDLSAEKLRLVAESLLEITY